MIEKEIDMNPIITSCEHLHVCVYGGNRVGAGTCLDCGRQIGLDVAFDILLHRMRKAIGIEEKGEEK